MQHAKTRATRRSVPTPNRPAADAPGDSAWADRRHDDVRSLLADHGLRYSRARAAILAFFREADRHVSAEQLFLDLKGRGENLSLSTVYLNLNVLKEAGLVKELPLQAGETVYDSNVSPHYHLVCKRCGVVVDLMPPEDDAAGVGSRLREYARRQSGWKVDEPVLSLRGICADCSD